MANGARYGQDILCRSVNAPLRTPQVRQKYERRATSLACAVSETPSVSGRSALESYASTSLPKSEGLKARMRWTALRRPFPDKRRSRVAIATFTSTSLKHRTRYFSSAKCEQSVSEIRVSYLQKSFLGMNVRRHFVVSWSPEPEYAVDVFVTEIRKHNNSTDKEH